MKEILDDFSNEEEPVKPIFSKISFVFGIVSLLVAIVILFEFYELKKTLIPAYYIIYSPSFLLLKIGCGAGVLMTILSYVRGEPSNIYKIAGALINFFILGLIFFSHLFLIPTPVY